MICRNCGAEIADSSKFCKICGAHIMPVSPADDAGSGSPEAAGSGGRADAGYSSPKDAGYNRPEDVYGQDAQQESTRRGAPVYPGVPQGDGGKKGKAPWLILVIVAAAAVVTLAVLLILVPRLKKNSGGKTETASVSASAESVSAESVSAKDSQSDSKEDASSEDKKKDGGAEENGEKKDSSAEKDGGKEEQADSSSAGSAAGSSAADSKDEPEPTVDPDYELFDPFDGVKVVFEGINWQGTASVVKSEEEPYKYLTYTLDKADKLANGDEVVVTMSSDPSIIESEFHMTPTAAEKSFTVEGLGFNGEAVTNPVTVYEDGIDYAPVYDFHEYVTRYPDVYQAYGDDDAKVLAHFVKNGMKEGRIGRSTFDVQKYKANYEDLQKAFGDDLVKYYLHYINSGQKENRKAS